MRVARTVGWLAFLLLAAAAQTAAPKTAGAQTTAPAPALTGTLTMASGRARTGAPVWLDVELNNRTAGLIEGQLDISFLDGRELLGRYRGWDMALTDGVQRFRIMLPQPAARGRSALDVRMFFVTAKGTLDLGWQALAVAPLGERVCVVAVGGTDRSSTGPPGLMRSLQLERYDPDRASRPGGRLTTFPAVIAAGDFPVDPLGYCPYDIVLLPADAFALVRQRQLEALEHWVEAGGSVCVLPGAGLKPYHADILNALTGRDGTTFAVSADGHLSGGEAIGLFRCGLGRAVIVTQMPEALDSAEWRRAVAFLWKLRDGEYDAFVKEGRWVLKPAPEEAPHVPVEARPSLPQPLPVPDTMGVLPLASAAGFYQPLMPESIRIIPFGWVVLLLVAFVVAIGPADYLLLGLIKRRKLTWVLFPALCIGFTGGTVLMARYCLGTNDHRGAFVFVDLGRGGRVLRTSRYELVYAAREFSSVTPYRDALMAAVDPAALVPNPIPLYGGNYYGGVQSADSAPFDLAGRVPGGYEVHRLIRQWTPQLTRVFSIGGKGPDLGLHWDDVTPKDLPWSAVDKLVGAGHFDGEVFVVSGKTIRNVGDSAHGGFALRPGGPPDRLFNVLDFLRDATARPAEGLFRVVSQVAPTGSGDFEDMSMLDPSDDTQWVVIAVQRQGDDYVVCRRLYCGGP